MTLLIWSALSAVVLSHNRYVILSASAHNSTLLPLTALNWHHKKYHPLVVVVAQSELVDSPALTRLKAMQARGILTLYAMQHVPLALHSSMSRTARVFLPLFDPGLVGDNWAHTGDVDVWSCESELSSDESANGCNTHGAMQITLWRSLFSRFIPQSAVDGAINDGIKIIDAHQVTLVLELLHSSRGHDGHRVPHSESLYWFTDQIKLGCGRQGKRWQLFDEPRKETCSEVSDIQLSYFSLEKVGAIAHLVQDSDLFPQHYNGSMRKYVSTYFEELKTV